MATYSAITNAEVDPDSPITTSLATKWRDNPIASHKYIRRTIAGPVVANTVLVDDTVLEFAADASTTYAFKFVCAFQTAGASNRGVRTAIDVPAGATLSVLMLSVESCLTAAIAGTERVGSYFTTTDDDPGIFDSGVLNIIDPCVLLEGMVTTVGAGDVKLRYAQGSSVGAESVTIQAGSYLTYHRVDAI